MFHTLRNKRQADDMLELAILAKKNLEGVHVTFRKYLKGEAESKVKKLIGFNPLGTFQILFEKDKKSISCVRGMLTSGLYEIFAIKGIEMKGPERFEDPKDVIRRIRALFL